VTVYLDASVLVSLLTSDASSARADTFVRTNPVPLIISDFAGTEFCSAIARRVRTSELTEPQARKVLAEFDSWSATEAGRAEMNATDIGAAQSFLRRLDLPLRTGDAINIAIAQRLGAMLATFDGKMAASARTLGVAVCDA
jgi:uncharacterized protein